ncbi:hypothetical protein [Amycolatopsis sp. NPDC059657]|uniref:hypothetical protein n=1 Tax=Amycolatopsis sp. NPDC059657 TaxID=3346899 RepID=UPI0036727FEF
MAVEPVGTVVARSEHATISVVELRTYADGCVIEVEASASTGTSDPGEVLRSGMSPTPGDGETAAPPAVLRFSVRLADGSVATTLDHPLVPASEPARPYFAALGGPGFGIDGNQLRTRQALWLWPAPADRFDLVVEWPLFDIAETIVPLAIPGN